MVWQSIRGCNNIKNAFDRMKSAFVSNQSEERNVSTPAGITNLTIYWHNLETFRAWCGFRDPDARPQRKYWNCFGVEGFPGEQLTLSPSLEINPPPEGGLDLRYGGVFLSNTDSKETYLGHTGRITIHHRQGVLTREEFIGHYQENYANLPIETIYRANQADNVQVVLIGSTSEAVFRERVLNYVKDVKAIKDYFRQEDAG